MGLTQNTVTTIYEYLYGLGRLIGTKQRPAVTSNIALDISRGKIEGAFSFSSYGKRTTSGAESGVIWANGAWLAPPAVGVRLSIVSTSASDGVGGTGIRSLEIHYLDANLYLQHETIVLNGVTPVLTVATNIRFIQCGRMITYGTGKAAAGIITFKDSITAQTYNQISVGENRCSSSARMVPKSKRLVITGLVGSSISGSAQTSALLSIATSNFEGHDLSADSVLTPLATIGVQDGSQAMTMETPLIFTEGAIIAMTYSVDKAAIVTGTYFGWLENNV